jgi:hypothetical protein
LIRLYEHRAFFPVIALPVLLLAMTAFTIPAILAPDSDRFINISAAIWLSITLMVYLVHIRTWDFHKNRFDAYREITRWEGAQDTNLEIIQERIEKLGVHLRLQRLTVLEIFRPDVDSDLRNPEEEILELPAGADLAAVRPPHYVKIIAKYPPGEQDKSIKPWPLSRGLLHEARSKRIPLLCMDNRIQPWDTLYYNPPDARGFRNTLSEFVIPIFDNPDGEVIGFADLQSDIAGGLQEEEADYLRALAAMISPLLVSMRLRTFLAKLEKLRHSLEYSWNEEEAFAKLAMFARQELDADVITYYKLGYGNGWPLLPPMQLGAWYPDSLNDERFRRNNPAPVLLVANWRSLFEANSRTNPKLFTSDQDDASEKDYFILRENIRSTAFLPVGTRTRRIGALFLNYRESRVFSETDRLILDTFLQTIIPYLERTRRKVDIDKGFEHELLVLHDLLAKSIDSSNLLSSGLPKLWGALSAGDNAQVKSAFDELSSHLNLHIATIHSASLKTSLDALKLLQEGLDDALGSASGQLEQKYGGRGFRWILLPLEINTGLPVNFRLAIFSIVVEASHNAIREGDAHQVNVTITRGENFIVVEVVSDGNPWDWKNPPSSYTSYGIRSRLRLAFDTMDADYRWEEDGRKLVVTFPVLPTLHGRDAYD